ncbi:MAG: hypothetical protein SNF33_05600 [Candidatus Algichlamydia australiensis]|nr:hypothetical protein [Chlamydiales bacterium]
MFLSWFADAKKQEQQWHKLDPDLELVCVVIEEFVQVCGDFFEYGIFIQKKDHPAFQLLISLEKKVRDFYASENILLTDSFEKISVNKSWIEIQKLAQKTENAIREYVSSARCTQKNL